MYSTPFVLDKDRNNKHKVVNDVEKSMETSTQIPFLRSQVDPRSFSKTQHGTFMGSYLDNRSNSLPKNQIRKARLTKKKEAGWNSFIKPISKYNA